MQEYNAKLVSKCAEDKGTLVIRLPARGADVDALTGRTGMDLLLVTSLATVETHARWIDTRGTGGFWWLFRQFVQTDTLQAWREAYDDTSICLRFAIALSPLLISWYYLTLRFEVHCLIPNVFPSSSL